MILFKRQPAYIPGISVVPVQISHMGGAGNTGHTNKWRTGREYDIAIGQITSLVIVHIRFFYQGQGHRHRIVNRHFTNAPRTLRIRHGHQHLAPVKVQFQITHEGARFGAIECRKFWPFPRCFKQGDFIVVAPSWQTRISLPVLGQPQLAFTALD